MNQVPPMPRDMGEHRFTRVERGPGGRWIVYCRGNFISGHASRDGAVTAARQVERVEREMAGES
jgi:hypothetical protein